MSRRSNNNRIMMATDEQLRNKKTVKYSSAPLVSQFVVILLPPIKPLSISCRLFLAIVCKYDVIHKTGSI